MWLCLLTHLRDKAAESGARATPNACAHFRSSSGHWCRLYMIERQRPCAAPPDLAASSTKPTLQQQPACSRRNRRWQPGPCVRPFGQQHVHHAKGRCFQARTHNAAAWARREADVSSFKIFNKRYLDIREILRSRGISGFDFLENCRKSLRRALVNKFCTGRGVNEILHCEH